MKTAFEKTLGDHRRTRNSHGYDWEYARNSKTEKDWENGPTRQSMRQHGHIKGSERGYVNYGIVKSFLLARVGKLWSDVYSEYCSKIDKRTYIGEKASKAIKDCVELHTEIKDGKIAYLYRYGKTWNYIEEESGSFYVHPETKKLCYVPKKKRSIYSGNAGPKLQWLQATPTLRVAKIKGVWYGFDLIKNEKETIIKYGPDKKDESGNYIKDENGKFIRDIVKEYQDWKQVIDHFDLEKSLVESKTRLHWSFYRYHSQERVSSYYGEKRTLSRREKKKYKID